MRIFICFMLTVFSVMVNEGFVWNLSYFDPKQGTDGSQVNLPCSKNLKDDISKILLIESIEVSQADFTWYMNLFEEMINLLIESDFIRVTFKNWKFKLNKDNVTIKSLKKNSR